MQGYSYDFVTQAIRDIETILSRKHLNNGTMKYILSQVSQGKEVEIVDKKTSWRKIAIFRDYVSGKYIIILETGTDKSLNGESVCSSKINRKRLIRETSSRGVENGTTVVSESKQMRKHTFLFGDAIKTMAYATKMPEWEIRLALRATLSVDGVMSLKVSNSFSISLEVKSEKILFYPGAGKVTDYTLVSFWCTNNNEHRVYRRLRKKLKANAQKMRYRLRKKRQIQALDQRLLRVA